MDPLNQQVLDRIKDLRHQKAEIEDELSKLEKVAGLLDLRVPTRYRVHKKSAKPGLPKGHAGEAVLSVLAKHAPLSAAQLYERLPSVPSGTISGLLSALTKSGAVDRWEGDNPLNGAHAKSKVFLYQLSKEEKLKRSLAIKRVDG